MEGVILWSAVAANLLSMGLSLWNTLRMHRLSRRLRLGLDSPFYHCATRGHDMEFEVIVLDKQDPPDFTLTHLCRLTCKREGCEYSQLYEVQARVYAPGIEQLKLTWEKRPPAD